MNPSQNSSSRSLFIVSGFVMVLLFVIIILVSVFSRQSIPSMKKKSGETGTVKTYVPTGVPTKEAAALKVVPPPAVEFKQYDIRSSLPQIPEKLMVYKLKNNFSVEDAKQLASKFGLTNQSISEDKLFVNFTNFSDKTHYGLLSFELRTGRFFFHSYGDHKVARTEPNQSPLTVASSLVQNLGFDQTVTCLQTYKKKNEPDFVYVECHRDWSNVGLPILNTVGVINIPESERLAQQTLGKPDTAMPSDSSIIETNNGTEGKVRSNDFNTLTVVLSQSSGRIMHIESNLRQIESQIEINREEMIDPSAIPQAVRQSGLLTLTLPSGSGYTPWDRVYQQNRAAAERAVVQEVMVSYVENPAGLLQDYLLPVYIVRGTAKLETGYNIKYIKILSATRRTFALLPTIPEVAGVSTLAQYSDRTPKQGTFDLQEPTSSPSPTTLPPPSSPPPPACTSNSGAELTLKIPGLGDVTVTYPQDNAFKSREISIKSSTFPYNDMDSLRELFFWGTGDEPGPIGQQYIISVARLLINSNPIYRIPSVTPPQTVDEAKRLFVTINKTIGPGGYGRMQMPKEFCGASPAFAWMAPPVPDDVGGCPSIQKSPSYESTQAKLYRPMMEKVAAKIVAAVKNNTLKTLADQPDIFPADITGSFQQILYSPYGLENDPTYKTSYKYLFTCRITGSSPRLFIYSKDKVQVSVHAPLTYTDPPLIHNSWTTVGNSSFYYEYNKSKIKLNTDTDGYVLSAQNWEKFVKESLASQLQLKNEETEALITDIKNELWQVKDNYKYIILRPIDEASLNTNLPLVINPVPYSLRRIHFGIQLSEMPISIKRPDLKPIQRGYNDIIEVGARLE